MSESSIPIACARFPDGEIPDGWVVCDGKNGTPDINEKSIDRMRVSKQKIDEELRK